MEWIWARVQFLREMPTSLPVRLALGVWFVLTVLSTLEVVFPQIAGYVPRWPWYVWIIGFLVIAIAAVFEGGFRQVRKLKGLSGPLALSLGLSALPTYRQDLEIEIVSVCVGLCLVRNATVFIELKLWALRDLNLASIVASIKIDDTFYNVRHLKNFSRWIVNEQLLGEHHRVSSEDARLDSLHQEIESGMFREGHHEPKWIGYELPLKYIKVEQIKAIRIAFQDKHGIAGQKVFRDWPTTTKRVLDIDFRL